ncbi:MAG: alkaline phosphatase [Dysgonamonadaceae bacterium]|jgi:alkaline phosphatase|nr:alkaline phosphatase [Dysgonamonadaceae bacterium]
MKIRSTFTLLIFAAISIAANAQNKVKNVIFMIGDGMGLSQAYAAQTHKGEQLTLFQFPYVGLVSTYSANNYITDSAAAGTAISSGVKTNNGIIGITPDSLHHTVSVMEIAKQKGLATGIGVTCTVTHATPAAYYAHQINRGMNEEIASDLLLSNIDICIGGGRNYFEDRTDKKNLSNLLRERGYDVVYNLEEATNTSNKRIIGLLADGELPTISENRGNMLPQTTGLILNKLDKDNKNGFFVMIEGSQIDWGGHANNEQYIINETIDFDNAVKIAVDFAKKDGNTLVIVTADHETGGMTLAGGNIENKIVDSKFSTGNHTATPVPVYTFGPGAENFTGYFDNTEFKDKIIHLLDLESKRR